MFEDVSISSTNLEALFVVPYCLMQKFAAAFPGMKHNHFEQRAEKLAGIVLSLSTIQGLEFGSRKRRTWA